VPGEDRPCRLTSAMGSRRRAGTPTSVVESRDRCTAGSGGRPRAGWGVRRVRRLCGSVSPFVRCGVLSPTVTELI
jgi:hypothetical protein